MQLTAEALLTPACQPQRKTHFWVAGLVRLGNDTHTISHELQHLAEIILVREREPKREYDTMILLIVLCEPHPSSGSVLEVSLFLLYFLLFLTFVLLSSRYEDPSVDVGSVCVAAGRNKVRIAYCSTLLSQATARAHMLLNNKDVMFPHLKTSCFMTSHRHTLKCSVHISAAKTLQAHYCSAFIGLKCLVLHSCKLLLI